MHCFGLQCPPGSVLCEFEEVAIAGSDVRRESSCYGLDGKVLLRAVSQAPNSRGEVILNNYRFYGPGVYDKERVNYSRKRLFKKRSKSSLDLQLKEMNDMRQKMQQEFAKKLKGNVMGKF